MGDTVQLGRAYTVRKVGELEEMLRRNVIDEIVFTVDSQTLAQMEELFLMCDEEGVRTRVVVDFFPHVNSEVFLDRFGKTPLLTFSATPHDEIQLFLKRSFDVAAAAMALAVLAMPIALVALLIRATSKGPALFRQVRCGLNGRRFTFYKFRSMVDGAEEMLDEVAHLNERDGPVFKIANDPRLTAIGRYLRRYSIDEWPQFWNVLRGDMSFVGPRPAVPSEVEHYKIWQRRRLRMRPGLTCLWALQGRDKVDFERWMRLDLEYIDTWSLTLDFKILMQSIPRVLAGEGAS
jgi:exopolysaccharide biosynthesis polyprenyl glycosylphosphotransferase